MKYLSSVKDVDYFNDNHNLQRVEGSQYLVKGYPFLKLSNPANVPS